MEQDWFIYSITLFTFSVIFLFCYIRYIYTFFDRNRIVTAKYPTFPFGNVYDVVFQRIPMFMQLWKFYNRLKRKNCKYGGFYVFLKPALVITDSRLSQTILTKKDHFEDLNSISDNFNKELKEKLLLKIPNIVQNVWSKILGRLENEEVNFSHIMDQDFVEMIFRGFFDLRYVQTSKENGNLEKRSIFYCLWKFICINYSQFKNRFYKLDRKNFFYDNALEKVITERQNSNLKKDDVLQVLLDNGLYGSELKDLIFDIMYNLKISNNLTLFTLYELSINQEIQEDLRGEITRFIKINNKNKSSLDYNVLKDLAYLETVVSETLRKYPAKPFVCKICKVDYLEEEVKLSKELILFISSFGIHHDAQNYINPELFDPDRFSEENEKFIDATKYLPFGSTNKDDSGSLALLVKLVMKLTLIEFFSRFKFSLGKNSPEYIQFDETSFDLLKTKEDMWLKISKVT